VAFFYSEKKELPFMVEKSGVADYNDKDKKYRK